MPWPQRSQIVFRVPPIRPQLAQQRANVLSILNKRLNKLCSGTQLVHHLTPAAGVRRKERPMTALVKFVAYADFEFFSICTWQSAV